MGFYVKPMYSHGDQQTTNQWLQMYKLGSSIPQFLKKINKHFPIAFSVQICPASCFSVSTDTNVFKLSSNKISNIQSSIDKYTDLFKPFQ